MLHWGFSGDIMWVYVLLKGFVVHCILLLNGWLQGNFALSIYPFMFKSLSRAFSFFPVFSFALCLSVHFPIITPSIFLTFALSLSPSWPLFQSIDPGQQFTWENSNMEVNKPKNRYANVIAYDHSRVVLTSVDGKSSCNYLTPQTVTDWG